MYTCYFHCPADYVLWQDDAFRTEIMSIITDDSSIIIQFISEEEQLNWTLYCNIVAVLLSVCMEGKRLFLKSQISTSEFYDWAQNLIFLTEIIPTQVSL